MKTLIVLRGLDGGLRKRWIKDNELELFTISLDELEKFYKIPQMTMDNKIKATPVDQAELFYNYYRLIDYRMRKGNLVVLDSENIAIDKLLLFSKTFGYTCFTKSFPIPHDLLNKKEDQGVLGTKVLDYLKFGKNLSSSIEIETYQDILDYWSNNKPVVFKDKEIIFVGDIHGNYDILKSCDKLCPELNPNTSYVFLGDYVDRGPRNKEVLDYLLDCKEKFQNRVFLLEGNHELHLRRFLSPLRNPKKREESMFPILYEDFMTTTGKDFENLPKEKCLDYLNKLNQFLIPYLKAETDTGETYICSHAGVWGFSQLDPKVIGSVIYGDKLYGPDATDINFSRVYKDKVTSIHGHCKYMNRSAILYPNVINLDPTKKEEIIYYNSLDNTINIIE